MLTPDDVHHHRAPDVLAQRGSSPCKPPGPFTPNASSTAPRNPPRFLEAMCDQPSCHFHNRRNESVNRNRRCLKVVDRFLPRASPQDSRSRTIRCAICSGLQALAHRLCCRGPCRRPFHDDVRGPSITVPSDCRDPTRKPILHIAPQRLDSLPAWLATLSANITETPAPLGITVGRWR